MKAVVVSPEAKSGYIKHLLALPEIKQAEACTPGEWENTITKVSPDVICIDMPLAIRGEWIKRAIGYGKPIIVKAPLSGTWEETQALYEAAARQQVPLFCGHAIRFAPHNIDIQRKLQQDAIGSPGVIHVQRHIAAAEYTDSEHGDVILEQMVQDIELMRWQLGDVQSVYAMRTQAASKSYALITLRFKNRAIVNLECLLGAPGKFRNKMEFAGKQGIIRYDSKQTDNFELHLDPDERGREHWIGESLLLHAPELLQLRYQLSLIAMIRTDAGQEAEALAAQQIAFAAVESAASGMPVRLGDPV